MGTRLRPIKLNQAASLKSEYLNYYRSCEVFRQAEEKDYTLIAMESIKPSKETAYYFLAIILAICV